MNFYQKISTAFFLALVLSPVFAAKKTAPTQLHLPGKLVLNFDSDVWFLDEHPNFLKSVTHTLQHKKSKDLKIFFATAVETPQTKSSPGNAIDENTIIATMCDKLQNQNPLPKLQATVIKMGKTSRTLNSCRISFKQGATLVEQFHFARKFSAKNLKDRAYIVNSLTLTRPLDLKAEPTRDLQALLSGLVP